MKGSDEPVWVLLGQRIGDNNQLLRLAAELDVPFRTLKLQYNALHLIPPNFLRGSFASLTPGSRAQIQPPWPKLVLGIGYRSVPVALAIREMSGGKSKLVRLGNPRLDPSNFDLVITTPQYRVGEGANVLHLRLGISTAAAVDPNTDERDWLARLPRPHRLLLIGGDTFMWRLAPQKVAQAASRLAQKPGGSVIAVRSGRTRTAILDAVAKALEGSKHAVLFGRFPRYPVLIQDADEIFVTADSVAMVSDAISSGKPVGLIEPDQSLTGRALYGLEKIGMPVPVRDIRRFWRSALDEKRVGTIDRPVAGKAKADPLKEAVEAVRGLLGD